jgi:hypothetical protein
MTASRKPLDTAADQITTRASTDAGTAVSHWIVPALSWCKTHAAGVAGSLAIHGAAAIVLLTIMLERERAAVWHPLEVMFQIPQPEDAELLTSEALLEIESPPVEPLIQQVNFNASVAASASASSSMLPDQMPELHFDGPTLPVGGQSDRGTKAGSGGDGPRGSGNGGQGTSFFGKKVAVKSVAFVIDASGSMQGARFVRARAELVSALMQMKQKQEFFIVFYTDQTYPLFWPQSVVSLLPANAENLRKTGLWLERARTSGGTQPQEAMSLALSLKPDVIFLLSDGDIPPETRDIVARTNKGSIIHTIALGSNTGAAVMRQIAEENQGEFRFIPDAP